MAEPMWAWRPTSLNLYRAQGDKRATAYGRTSSQEPALGASALTGAIGSVALDLNYSNAANGSSLLFQGRNNFSFSSGQSISILMRVAIGATASNLALFGMYTANGYFPWNVGFHYNGASGIRVQAHNKLGTNLLNNNVAWSPSTGVFYDLLMTYTGGTTNALKMYVDGVQVGSSQSPSPAMDTWDRDRMPFFYFGSGGNGFADTRIQVNEACMWNEIIDPTAVTLTSGSGALNGASRTAYVSATALDGLDYTAFTADQIKTGLSYTLAGVAGTGTYDAVERYTDVTEARVQSAYAYAYNSLTNNKVGTYLGGVVATRNSNFYGLEELMVDIGNLMRTVLNSKIDAMNTSKADSITLSNIQSNAIFMQSMSQAQANFNPFIWYGVMDIEPDAPARYGASSTKAEIDVILVIEDAGLDVNVAQRLFRYQQCLKEIFEENFDGLSERVKLSIQGQAPVDLVNPNTSRLSRAIGITLRAEMA